MLNVKKITLRKYNNYMLEIFKYLTYKNYIKNIIIFFPIIFEDINSVSITSLSVYLLFFISMFFASGLPEIKGSNNNFLLFTIISKQECP